MFALVEFLEGVDKGARSIVPFNCIKNGQAYEDEFLAEGELDLPGPVLVEWREHIPGRKKKSPWPVYQATVLCVASK